MGPPKEDYFYLFIYMTTYPTLRSFCSFESNELALRERSSVCILSLLLSLVPP